MSLIPPRWKCQNGAKCMVHCPGCPGPLPHLRRDGEPMEAAFDNVEDMLSWLNSDDPIKPE